MVDEPEVTTAVADYVDALQEENMLGAINHWNTLQRQYLTGAEPGQNHKIVYEYETDTVERVPPLPLPGLVTAYNERAAEKQRPTADTAEIEEYDWQQEILLDTMDDEFFYFGTIGKSFYEQSGRLFMLDESTEPPAGGDPVIEEIDTVTDGLSLDDLMEQYSVLQRYGDIDWHDRFENAARVRDAARELYTVGEKEATELLYDGESAYIYDRAADTFSPIAEENVERLQDSETSMTLFEEAFDLSDLEDD